MRRLGGVVVGVVALVGLAAACSGGGDGGSTASGGTGATGAPGTSAAASGTTALAALPPGYDGYRSSQYGDGQHWLCRPGNASEDVCLRDLTATVVRPGGASEIEAHTIATDPPIDCFYVYPTISNDPGLNADLEPEEANEIWAAVNQVSRLNSTCRVFAPVYRQLTLGSLLSRQAGREDAGTTASAREIAYGDVLDAWKHYLANDNQGRGVILVGHSQGAGVLKRLLAEEIDDEPAVRDRLVSAYLLGTTVAVPDGRDVGGDLQNIPLCRAGDQTGCVVTYASFPASSPPPDNSLFGNAAPGSVAGCTNPAALAGGRSPAMAYFARETAAEGAASLAGAGAEITTPWVAMRDVLTVECVVRNGRSVLEVTVGGNPSDPRDQVLRGGLPANWGTHLADANIVMGDLEALAARQAAAHTAGR